VQALALGTKSGKLGLNVGWVEFERSEADKPNLTLMAYDVYQADWAFNDKFLVGFEYGKNTKAVSEGAFTSWKAVYGPGSLTAPASRTSPSPSRSSTGIRCITPIPRSTAG
jgi:hypothetical protein